MFTGLIADLGEITDVAHSPDGVVLTVSSALTDELSEGDSIAVNGVCLTATAVAEDRFSAEVMNETLRLSSLAEAGAGSPVNLELRAARDRTGSAATSSRATSTGSAGSPRSCPTGSRAKSRSRLPSDVLRYVVHKGSITVDGISLTVSGLGDRSFTVSLIPETLERTNLGEAEAGTVVNLEVDVLAKYVERLMRR